MNKNEKIGARIKEVRQRVGKNQREFGATVGMNLQRFSRVETGKLEATASEIAAISERYGVSTDWLLCRDDEEPEIHPRLVVESRRLVWDSQGRLADLLEKGTLVPKSSRRLAA